MTSLTNRTTISRRLLLNIYWFVRPTDLAPHAVEVRRRRRGDNPNFRAWCLWRQSPIKVVVLSGKRTLTNHKIPGSGYLQIHIRGRLDVLIFLMAHELRHVWQTTHGKCRMDERDADRYALKKLKEFRNYGG